MHTLKRTGSTCRAPQIDFQKVSSLSDLPKSKQVHFYGMTRKDFGPYCLTEWHLNRFQEDQDNRRIAKATKR